MSFELFEFCADNGEGDDGEGSIKVKWSTGLKSEGLIQFCTKTFSGIKVNCRDQIVDEGKRVADQLRGSSRMVAVSQRERCGMVVLDGGWKAHKKRRNDAHCMYTLPHASGKRGFTHNGPERTSRAMCSASVTEHTGAPSAAAVAAA